MEGVSVPPGRLEEGKMSLLHTKNRNSRKIVNWHAVPKNQTGMPTAVLKVQAGMPLAVPQAQSVSARIHSTR